MLKLISTQMSHDGLIKAVRSLDQSSAESIPETLSKLWTLLSNSISGPFHASEELVLRWLLKNMNATAESAEQFRRYPMAWSIMACVFKRVPLISLAKSLADRRFIPILQQTLKDISQPQARACRLNDASSDVEMADGRSSGPERSSKKRKRSSEVQFDLESMRDSHGCLAAAEALFDALRTLLERLESVDGDAPSSIRMGVEHVKSLFCSPAKDAVELLRPILSICDLALQQQELEPFENQASWIATFATLWDLHLQSSNDANEVAVSLFPTGCVVLAKMDRSKDLILDPHVKATWTRDLRRFFIKNTILPARASFLNRKDIETFKAAVDVTNFMPTASYPVLFSLAVKTPYSTEDASARKDHEDWTQKVFEVIEEPMREADGEKRNQAMRIILDTALASKASISLSSLRTVCRQYFTTSDKMDLNLIVRVANLDVDAFLISKDGHTLLDDLLKQLTSLKNTELAGLADTDPVSLIVSLAKGFARGRDLSGFIKKWFEALAQCCKQGAEYSAITDLWSSNEVIDAVSSLLQHFTNARQLVTILDWLESQQAGLEPNALLVVLDAVSQGISEEEFVDTVNFRLYETISTLRLKSLDDATQARWWRIIENVVSRSTLQQNGAIWAKVEPDLKKILKKGAAENIATIGAFRCSSRFWLANYPGGPHEAQAAAMTGSFLSKHAQQTTPRGAAGGLMLYETPRLVQLLANSENGENHLPALFTLVDQSYASKIDIASIVHNEANLNNYKYVNGLVSHAVEMLAQEDQNVRDWNVERITAAARVLLDVPCEVLTREQREQIMPKAILFVSSAGGLRRPLLLLIKTLLSLMVKIMKRPTFYEDMKFSDLVVVGDSIIASLPVNHVEGDTDSDDASAYGVMKLYEAFVSATLRQMTSNLDQRERAYLTDAFSQTSTWPQTTELCDRPMIARSLILTLESSKILHQAREVVDPAILRKHISIMLANHLSTERLRGITEDANWLITGSSTSLLVEIEQLDVVEPAIIRHHLSASRVEVERLGEMLCRNGVRAGWRLKELLYSCYGDTMRDPLNINAHVDVLRRPDGVDSIPLCLRADAGDVNKFVDVVLRSMSEETRNEYFGAICEKLRAGHDLTGHLFAIHRLIRAESGTHFLQH